MFSKKFFYLLSSFVVLLFGFAPRVHADTDLSVTGNGGSSSNQVNVANSSQTTVQQSNAAAVSNTVNTTQNTGNNSASNDSGNINVTTGNTTGQTTLNTTANNSSVDKGCGCSGSSSTNITVANNGTGSQNNAGYTTTSQVNTVISNNAAITNMLTETESTGNNHADDNTGNVSIHTGDIAVHNSFSNTVDSAKMIGSSDSTGGVSISVSGNGTGSVNTVNVSNESSVNTVVTNVSNISNIKNSDLHTGGNSANGNSANGNSGVVDITTGSILFDTQISNTANNSSVEETMCQKDPADGGNTPSSPVVPGSSANPSTPAANSVSAGSSSVSNSSSGVSQAATASMGDSLPVTGANWFLFMVIGNVLMFFLGAYLRLRSGRSPGFLLGF